MTQKNYDLAHQPRPTVHEIQARLRTELSMRTRLVYTLLLLFDLAVGCAVTSLWWTEPDLPARTHIAFAGIVLGTLVWAVYFTWTLTRRKVLFARHRLVACSIAVTFTGLFSAGALILAALVPTLRETGLAASALGGVLLIVASFLLRGALVRHRAMLERSRQLARELETMPV